MSSRSNEHFVADGDSRWWESEEGVEVRQQIEAEVRSRYRAEFKRAGRFKQLLLELRMQREMAAERAKVTLEILWVATRCTGHEVSDKGSGGPRKREMLYCEIKGLKARGYQVPNGFLVLKGSEAVHAERPSVDKWPAPRNMRQKLLEEGRLVDKRDRLVFAEDAEFSSPSAAAAIVHGGHANGLLAWKTKKGTTLKEMESY